MASGAAVEAAAVVGVAVVAGVAAVASPAVVAVAAVASPEAEGIHAPRRALGLADHRSQLAGRHNLLADHLLFPVNVHRSGISLLEVIDPEEFKRPAHDPALGIDPALETYRLEEIARMSATVQMSADQVRQLAQATGRRNCQVWGIARAPAHCQG